MGIEACLLDVPSVALALGIGARCKCDRELSYQYEYQLGKNEHHGGAASGSALAAH